MKNSLHGSVFEHYDLLLEHGAKVVGETLLRIRHNVIAAPGVTLAELRRVVSHPVALSQCRRWLREHPQIEVVPGYDTAGSVKDLMASFATTGVRDVAGIAPELAAQRYGAQVLMAGIEDHPENFTRFYALVRAADQVARAEAPDKMTLAFSVAHQPGTLIGALQVFRDAGLNLTRIESRPVHGRRGSMCSSSTCGSRMKPQQTPRSPPCARGARCWWSSVDTARPEFRLGDTPVSACGKQGLAISFRAA